MMVFPSSYVTKHGTAATMQIANISACRRIEHPDHSTRERPKRRSAEISSVAYFLHYPGAGFRAAVEH
jgi:hypothetical protein